MHIVDHWNLGATEKKEYLFDLNSELSTGETVTSVDLYCDPNDGQIQFSNMSVANGFLMFWVESPAIAQLYLVSAVATLSNQRIVTNTIAISGVEKASGEIVLQYP